MTYSRRLAGVVIAAPAVLFVACVRLSDPVDDADAGPDATVDATTDGRAPRDSAVTDTFVPKPDTSPTTTVCGTKTCASIANQVFTYLACCPAREPSHCGLQIPTTGVCVEPRQPGVEDTSCPVFLLPQAASDPDCQGLDPFTAGSNPAKRKCYLPGCCKPQGICGFLDKTASGEPLTLADYGCVYTDEFGVERAPVSCSPGTDAGADGDAGDADSDGDAADGAD